MKRLYLTITISLLLGFILRSNPIQAQDSLYVASELFEAVVVKWNHDGTLIATGSRDGRIQLWNRVTRNLSVDIQAHTGPIYVLSWSPDNSRVVSGGDDGAIRVWNAMTGESLALLSKNPLAIIALTWSPDGKMLASAGVGDYIYLWDMATYQLIKILDIGVMFDMAWSPNGTSLAVGNMGIVFFEATTGKRLAAITGKQLIRPITLEWRPDGEQVAYGSLDDNIYIANRYAENVLAIEGHTDRVFSVSWSPDGKQLASASYDGTMRTWNAANGQNLSVRPISTSSLWGVAWSPRGTHLAYGGENGSLHIALIHAAPPDLLEVVAECIADPGIQTSLNARIEASQWQPIINEVEALDSTKVSAECAAQIIEMAQYFIENPAED